MNTNKNNKIEDILNSLDGVSRASAPDFFYTRLKARMEKGLVADSGIIKKRVLYPVYALAAVIFVMLINATILISNRDTTTNTNSETASINETENLQSIAAEYKMTDVSSIYDINEER